MYHPFFGYLGVALTFTLTAIIFRQASLDSGKFFYVPILLLIAYYTVVSVVTDRQVYEERSSLQAFRKAVPKYLFWGLIIRALIWFYEVHPFYNWYAMHTRGFVQHFLYAYALGGLPYFFLEEKFRYCRDNFLADPYLRLVLLLKHLWRRDLPQFRRRLFSQRNRRTLLSWVIRIHYLPVMAEQVYYCITSLNWHNLLYDHSLGYIILLLTTFAWMIDSNNASIGYFWQSSFTKTRFRDVDPYPTHWIVVLSCYTPFIDFVTYYFVMFPRLAENSTRMFASPTVNNAIDLAIVGALVLYMLSGTALGFSYSNLCYKKTQTRGPYRFVRHPATTCKLAFFTLSFFRFADAYSARWVVCYVVWISIYIGRALLEERYLRRFPEYRAYMEQTPYRFFRWIA